MRRLKKTICVGDYFLPSTPPVPFKYDSWLLYKYQKKLTHYISMELTKKLTSGNPDNSEFTQQDGKTLVSDKREIAITCKFVVIFT